MKTTTPAARPEAYAAPSTRIISISVGGNMMLLNSNGTTTQTTPDLEEQDYSNIWGN